MADVTVGLADGKEVHAFLTDVVYIPAQLATDGQPGIGGIGRETVGVCPTLHR